MRNRTCSGIVTGNRESARIFPFSSSSTASRFERFELRARHRRESLSSRLPRRAHEPAQLWRHGSAHAHVIQLWDERGLSRGFRRAFQRWRIRADLLRWLLHGWKSRDQDGGRVWRRGPESIAWRLRRLPRTRPRALRRRPRPPRQFLLSAALRHRVDVALRKKTKDVSGALQAQWPGTDSHRARIR